MIIADGATWIWNRADQNFPGAIQIVDRFHARQHLWELSAKLFPNDEPGRKHWMARCLKLLDQGKVEAIVKILRDLHPAKSRISEDIVNEATPNVAHPSYAQLSIECPKSARRTEKS